MTHHPVPQWVVAAQAQQLLTTVQAVALQVEEGEGCAMMPGTGKHTSKCLGFVPPSCSPGAMCAQSHPANRRLHTEPGGGPLDLQGMSAKIATRASIISNNYERIDL